MKIKPAIRRAGSKMALARLLGVTRQAIQQFEKHDRLPAKRLEDLQRLRPEWFKVK
jgi:DNA-binding XRE family transcriptional regulator